MMKPLAGLAIIAVLCAVLLAATHILTADAIRANRAAATWRVVFELTGGPFPTVGLDWQDDRLHLPNGYRLHRTTVAGYAGPIELLVAFPPVDQGNSPSGVRVTRHRETPGLGDFVDTTRSPWIRQFSRRPPERVDAVTGATITSEAIKRGVSSLLQSMNQRPSQGARES